MIWVLVVVCLQSPDNWVNHCKPPMEAVTIQVFASKQLCEAYQPIVSPGHSFAFTCIEMEGRIDDADAPTQVR
jgi:hypothetical protein